MSKFERPFSFHQGDSPILVSMPHSGISLLPDMERKLSKEAKNLPDTDWYIPELYDFLPNINASIISANYSRYVVDLNRPVDDKPLYASKTTGLFPDILFSDQPVFINGEQHLDAIKEQIKVDIWQPYHDKIRSELARIKAKFGFAILFDAHSIAEQVPMLFDGKLPNFNFGNNDGNASAVDLMNGLDELVRATQYSHVSNGRFKGGYITRSFGQPDRDIHAIQLELSQATYLTDTPNEYQLDLAKKQQITPLLQQLIESLISTGKQLYLSKKRSSSMSEASFKEMILEGIPKTLPPKRERDESISHAPKRKDILNKTEKKLAIKNALRYFDAEHHEVLAKEFYQELENYGRIYMYRFMPTYDITARSIYDFPHQCKQAAGIMLMLSNNLDDEIAQHPEELITYGGNGAVFSNWVQYRLTMKYLAEMTDEQTLVLYSGHPMGLYPSNKDAPRVVVTNGMMIPNYSKPDDWEKFNALGVTQYGQMTAGSFMYIGPQGIVHGTTITVLNATRMIKDRDQSKLPIFVTSGLGGMSGAQPKAAVIAKTIGIVAEINPHAAYKRHQQGWVDEVHEGLDDLIARVRSALREGVPVSLAYLGNIVDLWERLAKEDITIDLGSDQTSLHNPWAGGYYPVGYSFEESNEMMANEPEKFKIEVHNTLKRHVDAIDKLTAKGMYFFDYGNAFLLEASRAGANITNEDGSFTYPSYVQDIMGPMCFDYGFGPFRWVCSSSDPKDLDMTDKIAGDVLEAMYKEAPAEIKQQIADNLLWIREAKQNKLVVGSQARILYADAEGRMRIAEAFNNAIKDGTLSAPIILGRDHHDVSGTDSPYRETSNIYDGSQFTADMAVQNVIGDSFRGATWVSIHNGGGVGWGEVVNGGFGMLLDGSEDCDRRLKSMLHWDVNNGISRRNWARNEGAMFAIKRAMAAEPNLKVTIPSITDDTLIDSIVQ
jgi:urocanate hydratase